MAKDITISPQPNLDLSITTVEPGDVYKSSLFEMQMQIFLDNDSALDTKLSSVLTINQDAITEVHLAANSVATINIQDGIITGQKIQHGTIENRHIAPGTIDETKLNITNAPTAGQHLTAGSSNDGTWVSVSPGTSRIVIADGSINVSDLDSTNTPTVGQFATAGPSDNFTYVDEPIPEIPPLFIVENMLRDRSVGTINIQDQSVTANKMLNGLVTDTHIQAYNITGEMIRFFSITTDKISSVSTTLIERGTLTSGYLVNGTFNQDRVKIGLVLDTQAPRFLRPTVRPGYWLSATIGNLFDYIPPPTIHSFIRAGSLRLSKLKAVNRRPVPGNVVIAGSNDDFDFETVPTAQGGHKLNVISGFHRGTNTGFAFRRGRQVWFFVLLQGNVRNIAGILTFPRSFAFRVPYVPSTGISSRIFCQSIQQLNHLDARWQSSMILTTTTSGAVIGITTGYSSELITVPGDKLVIASGMYFTL